MTVLVDIWVICVGSVTFLIMGRVSSLLKPVCRIDMGRLFKPREKSLTTCDLETIFRKLEEYMEEDKPYLNPNLHVKDVARHLLTNRSYMSIAVRRYDGGNFCSFVNRYRIKHSLDLFIKDPSLRVGEMAVRSGFNSPAAYNIAFKLHMNIPPGEWCRRYKMQNRPLSMRKP